MIHCVEPFSWSVRASCVSIEAGRRRCGFHEFVGMRLVLYKCSKLAATSKTVCSPQGPKTEVPGKQTSWVFDATVSCSPLNQRGLSCKNRTSMISGHHTFTWRTTSALDLRPLLARVCRGVTEHQSIVFWANPDHVHKRNALCKVSLELYLCRLEYVVAQGVVECSRHHAQSNFFNQPGIHLVTTFQQFPILPSRSVGCLCIPRSSAHPHIEPRGES